MAPRLDARVLGRFEVVRVDGEMAGVLALRRQSALLKYLLVQPAHAASAAAVSMALWPNSPPAAARTNLRGAVHALRRTLAAHEVSEAISTHRGRVALTPGWWRVDLDEFESAAARALAAEPPDRDALRTALERYHGPLLPEDLYEEWPAARRDAVAAVHRALLVRYGEVLAREGGERDLAYGERTLRLAFEGEPSDEAIAAALLGLQVRLGLRNDAQQTVRRLAAAIGGEEQLSAEVRGLRETALADASSRSARQGPPALWSPPPGPRFVGRQLEVARLGDLLDRAFDGVGGTALLVGDAGVGKSRTAAETIAEAQDRGALVLSIACWNVSEISTFSLLTAALDRAIEALSDDDVLEIFAGIAPRLLRISQALPLRLPTAAPLPPLPGYLEIQRYRTALIAAIENLTRRWPVVLAIDDVHAANEQTVALFSALITLAPAARLLVLATARTPEFEDSAASEVIELSSGAIEVIKLGPLEPPEAATLASTVVGSGVEPTEIAARSGGNPLFVLELARGGGDITSELRAASAERIARLTSRDRRVLELVALSRMLPLTERMIAEALAADEREVIAACERLMALGMLQRDRHGYAAAHQVLGEVAEESLGRERAEELHGRLGMLPEMDGRPAVAAYHLARAGDAYADEAMTSSLAMIARLQPVEQLARRVSTLRLVYARSDAHDPRRHALALALGRTELEVGSSAHAEEALNDALARAATPNERAGALVALAHLRALQLRVREGLALCDDAEALASEASLEESLWLVRAMLYGRTADPHGAERACEHLVTSGCNILTRIRAFNAVGTAYLNAGSLATAQSRFEAARDLAREHHAERELRAITNNLAILDLRAGRIRRARAEFAEAGEAAILAGHPWEAAVRARNAAEADLYLGDLAGAEQFLDRAEQRARRHGNAGLIAEVTMVRGLVRGDRNDHASAIRDLGDAAASFRAGGLAGRELECAAHALVAYRRGGIVPPGASLERMEELLRDDRDVETRAYALAALALAYGQRGERDLALARRLASLEQATLLAAEVRRVEFLLVLGETDLVLGDFASALALCERARTAQLRLDGERLARWIDDLSGRISASAQRGPADARISASASRSTKRL